MLPKEVLKLSSGLSVVLARPRIPFIEHYRVLCMEPQQRPPSSEEIEEMLLMAYRFAHELAEEHLGDRECFSVHFNGARTRRRPWIHFHIVLARSVRAKRWAYLCLSIKTLLRWWRWPLLSRLIGERGRSEARALDRASVA